MEDGICLYVEQTIEFALYLQWGSGGDRLICLKNGHHHQRYWDSIYSHQEGISEIQRLV